MEEERSLLSVSDAAQRLQRSTEQVRRYLREGRLQGRRFGGQWFIERSVLDGFVGSQQKQQGFLYRLPAASRIRPLDDVVGIGSGPGTNIGEGKGAYRNAAWRRR
jgi:excisionase family DNA binding protein